MAHSNRQQRWPPSTPGLGCLNGGLEVFRVLKCRLSNVVYRALQADLHAATAQAA